MIFKVFSKIKIKKCSCLKINSQLWPRSLYWERWIDISVNQDANENKNQSFKSRLNLIFSRNSGSSAGTFMIRHSQVMSCEQFDQLCPTTKWNKTKKWHLWTHRARNPDPRFANSLVGIRLKEKTNTSSTKAQIPINIAMSLFVPESKEIEIIHRLFLVIPMYCQANLAGKEA